jgi:hypothetical protein
MPWVKLLSGSGCTLPRTDLGIELLPHFGPKAGIHYKVHCGKKTTRLPGSQRFTDAIPQWEGIRFNM